MLSVLAHRATSFAMLAEVKPFKDFDKIAASRMIVWFKEPEGSFPDILVTLVNRYGLEKIGETELVYLYLNRQAALKKVTLHSPIPLGFCLSILFFAACLAYGESKNKS